VIEQERELRICDPCWDASNSPVDRHGCEAIMNFGVSDSAYLRLCDCPCRVDQHSDLDTIDLDHDMGVRDLTDPFDPNG
jgi:hypothetical protein